MMSDRVRDHRSMIESSTQLRRWSPRLPNGSCTDPEGRWIYIVYEIVSYVVCLVHDRFNSEVCLLSIHRPLG